MVEDEAREAEALLKAFIVFTFLIWRSSSKKTSIQPLQVFGTVPLLPLIEDGTNGQVLR